MQSLSLKIFKNPFYNKVVKQKAIENFQLNLGKIMEDYAI